VIKHDNVSRYLDVTASVRGRSLGPTVDEVRSRVAAMPMPLEFHAEVHSDTMGQQARFWRVGAAALAATLAIYLVLQAAFGSWGLASLVLLTLPLSLVGGVLTGGLVGGVRSLGALIGLLAVFGIAARSNVLLVRGLRRADGPVNPDLVNHVTRERVAPIVLSALTTIAAVLPLLFRGRVAGTEALFSFAVVVIGGLVTTTLLTVLVVPALYLRFAPDQGVRRPKPAAAEPSSRIPEGAV
jgi:multidrug efflux pump subunit AcrB